MALPPPSAAGMPKNPATIGADGEGHQRQVIGAGDSCGPCQAPWP